MFACSISTLLVQKVQILGLQLELNARTEIRKVLYQDKVEAKRRLAAEEAAAFFEKLLTGTSIISTKVL
jgi:hypothetical protein